MNKGTKEQIDILEEMLRTRADLAGEKSYAHMFLKDKMVKRPGKSTLRNTKEHVLKIYGFYAYAKS